MTLARWILHTLGFVAFLMMVMASAAFALGVVNEVFGQLTQAFGH